MSDPNTVVTTRSWGSRLGDAFKGILFGLLLFLVSFPVLWWNEGRTQGRHLALLEAAGSVISVDNSVVDPGREGRLIHSSGLVATEEVLQDAEFGIDVPQALQLRREVEMYQWQEHSSSKTEKNLGGSETTTTTYTYSMEWNSSPINSGSFHNPEGHQNPGSMPYSSSSQIAQAAHMGAFRISPDQVKKLKESQYLNLDGWEFQMISRPYQVRGDTIYIGNNPDSPQVGDLRIRFAVVGASQASIMGQQQNDALVPYTTRAGGKVMLMQSGEHTANAMLETAENQNRLLAWALRAGGFLMMFIGLRMVLAPLVVLGDVIPLLGTLVGMGTGLVAFLVALPLTLITIAIAWIFYRPLLAITLLVVAGASFAGIWFLRRRKGADKVAVPSAEKPGGQQA